MKLTKLRLSGHDLMIETGRFHNLPQAKRICKLCNAGIEDEEHFLLVCAPLNNIRLKFADVLPLHYHNGQISISNLKWILDPPAELCYTIGKMIAELHASRDKIIESQEAARNPNKAQTTK